jgi:hypothetical protein
VKFNLTGKRNRKLWKEKEQGPRTVAAAASISRRVFAVLAAVPPPVSEHVVSEKTIRRKTTGTGRMRYLRYISIILFKKLSSTGCEAAPRKNLKGASASS